MAYLIGMDEAGYGPNLGPLVIGASVWRIPGARTDYDLYGALRNIVTCDPAALAPGQVVIADSKVVYSPARGLGLLEANVLSLLGLIGKRATGCVELLSQVADAPAAQLQNVAGHDPGSIRLPCAAEARAVADLETSLRHAWPSELQLVDLRAQLVHPARFNQLLEELGNKSHLLSRMTLELARDVLATLPEGEPCLVLCDKHGGRNKYGVALQPVFAEYLVEVRRESAATSVYCWGPPTRRVEFRFSARGEGDLPVALASMLAKYLRELAMESWNAFWRRRIPGLRPTAGYPVDARRFKADIAALQAELEIPDDPIWRRA